MSFSLSSQINNLLRKSSIWAPPMGAMMTSCEVIIIGVVVISSSMAFRMVRSDRPPQALVLVSGKVTPDLITFFCQG